VGAVVLGDADRRATHLLGNYLERQNHLPGGPPSAIGLHVGLVSSNRHSSVCRAHTMTLSS
jgi:hypothetical protein